MSGLPPPANTKIVTSLGTIEIVGGLGTSAPGLEHAPWPGVQILKAYVTAEIQRANTLADRFRFWSSKQEHDAFEKYTACSPIVVYYDGAGAFWASVLCHLAAMSADELRHLTVCKAGWDNSEGLALAKVGTAIPPIVWNLLPGGLMK